MKTLKTVTALILNTAIVATCAYVLGFHVASTQPQPTVDQESIDRAVLAAMMEG